MTVLATDRPRAEPSTTADRYRRLAARRRVIILGLAVALVFSLLLDLSTGPASYSLAQVAEAIFSPSPDSQISTVIWQIRMPTALMAVFVGAALSASGAQMQTILSNPLASPFTLGISAAASFGAALALILGVNLVPGLADFAVPLNAFLMAALAAMLIHFLSQFRGVTVETIVLLGIALVFTFNALLGLMQYLASEQALAAVVFWTLGSLTKATWMKVGVTAFCLVAILPVFARQAWALTALRLGDEKAASFGVNVKSLRLRTMLSVSLLAAIPVSFVGTIGFIGLVGPHIARMLVGEEQRYFLPASVLSGALMLSLTSVVSKSLIPGSILPIGIITSLVGLPFFFMLIFSTRSRGW